MKKWWAINMGLIMFACVLVGTIAHAEMEDLDRSGSFGFRASYFDLEDANDSTWYPGAQLRLFFNEALGIEGSIDYREDDFGQTEVQVYPVQASLLGYLIPKKPVSLFILGGAGWYFTRIDRPSPFDDTTDDRFGLHAGGGLEFTLDEHWSIDSTYRYIWLEEFSSIAENNVTEKEFDDSGHQVTIGLNYVF